mmetsp:Transcript_41343/g.96670  ORF Transcript_41343/g.96670 Transcript_41343/m.96670 type:complete len:340 (-) Transcript_41343:603-1622(-)
MRILRVQKANEHVLGFIHISVHSTAVSHLPARSRALLEMFYLSVSPVFKALLENAQSPPMIGNSCPTTMQPIWIEMTIHASTACRVCASAALRLELADVLQVLRALDARHAMAALGRLPSCLQDGAVIVVVEATRLEEGLEVAGGLDGLVAGRGREDVVEDVRGADVMVHPVVEAKALRVRAVDGRKRALHPGPLVVAVVSEVLVRVLQPRVQHEPAVAHKIGRHVQEEDARASENAARLHEACEHEQHSCGRGGDAAAPLRREELRGWTEVIHYARDRLPAKRPPAAGRVCEQVDGPPQSEVCKQLEGSKSVVAEHIVQLVVVDPEEITQIVSCVRIV